MPFTPVEPTPKTDDLTSGDTFGSYPLYDMADWHDLVEAVEDHGRGLVSLTPFLEAWAMRAGVLIPAFGSDPSYTIRPRGV